MGRSVIHIRRFQHNRQSVRAGSCIYGVALSTDCIATCREPCTQVTSESRTVRFAQRSQPRQRRTIAQTNRVSLRARKHTRHTTRRCVLPKHGSHILGDAEFARHGRDTCLASRTGGGCWDMVPNAADLDRVNQPSCDSDLILTDSHRWSK